MAYKILGQERLTTTADTDIYTVPAGNETVVSTMSVTSHELNTTDLSIFIRKNNGGTVEASSEKNALMFEWPVESYNIIPFTIGVTLSAGDVITAKASNTNSISVQVYGNESEL